MGNSVTIQKMDKIRPKVVWKKYLQTRKINANLLKYLQPRKINANLLKRNKKNAISNDI